MDRRAGEGGQDAVQSPIASSPCLADDRSAALGERTTNIIVISLLCSLSLFANQKHGFPPPPPKKKVLNPLPFLHLNTAL